MRWKLFCTLLLAGVVLSNGYSQQRNNRSTAYYEEMTGNLSNQVRLLQDENASLAGKVHALQQEVRQMKQMLQGYQEEMGKLRRMITEESSARQRQMGTIADRIQQAADAQSKAEADRRAQREAEARRNAAQNTGAEEYDYYIVEAGATLSAVSRATGISVSRLKKANNMKNDVLRIGQKLKIPRK